MLYQREGAPQTSYLKQLNFTHSSPSIEEGAVTSQNDSSSSLARCHWSWRSVRPLNEFILKLSEYIYYVIREVMYQFPSSVLFTSVCSFILPAFLSETFHFGTFEFENSLSLSSLEIFEGKRSLFCVLNSLWSCGG